MTPSSARSAGRPPAPEKRPGRQRSEDSRRAILDAAGDLIAEDGYATLSIEKIARRSGTGKQTIYRWWPSKADVVMEALSSKADLHIAAPDTGTLAGDLRALLRSSFVLARSPQVREVMRALMAEAQLDAGFAERFRGEFLQHRRDVLSVVLERAAGRGDLVAGVSVHTATDVVFGVLWYRVLAVAAPLDNRLADELVTLLTPHPSP